MVRISFCCTVFEIVDMNAFVVNIPTQICFPIGGELVKCHGSKLTNSLGKQQLELRLVRDQVVHLETVAKLCAPAGGLMANSEFCFPLNP